MGLDSHIFLLHAIVTASPPSGTISAGVAAAGHLFPPPTTRSTAALSPYPPLSPVLAIAGIAPGAAASRWIPPPVAELEQN
jgi:hypothetical protein